MKVILEPLEAENYFHTALCNGLSAFDYYGISISYSPYEYEKAVNYLKENKLNRCYEDILLQILRNGSNLFIVDNEGNATEIETSLTIKDVHERLHNAPNKHLMDMILEQDDETTADVILQWVFFQEIIFG